MVETYEWKQDLKNYYDKLKGVDLSSASTGVTDSFSNSNSSLGKFSSSMSSGAWDELGKKEIELNVAPQLSTWANAIASNLAVLSSVCAMVSTLVGLLSELDSLINEYNSIKLSNYPTEDYNEDGSPIYDENKYKSDKKAKYDEIIAKENECYSQISSIKSTAAGIKDINVEITTVNLDGSSTKSVMSLDEFVANIADNITIGLDLSNFVDYDQTDSRWGGNTLAGAGNIFAYTGCGPTSAAMILRYLTGDSSITPDDLGEFASSHGYTCQGGTSGAMFAPAAQQYGIEVETQSQTTANITKNLEEGNLIIVATTQYGGHFIVVKGIAENGNYIVSDPYEPAGGQSLDGEVEPEDLEAIFQGTGMWVFKPEDTPTKTVQTVVE